MRRALLIGDVGGVETYHVGDEAMLTANLDALRDLFGGELEPTIVSAAPEATSRAHGAAAVPRLGFPRQGDENLIVRTVEDAGSASPSLPAVAALAASDVLIVSGGGNMNSTWRDHLHERVALLGAAVELGKPSVVLGQTLGPRLLDADRRLLAHALPTASFVGVRELDSFRLALRLGVSLDRLEYQLDDAALLSSAPAPEVELPTEPFVAVTLTGPAQAQADAWAPALAALHRRTGRPLVFVPHAAAPDDDVALGRALAERLGDALLPLPLVMDRQVADVTRRAAMVVSSRYHPLIFAAGGGVPALGLFSDDYTRVKLRGALRHAGLAEWTLDQRLLTTPVFLEAAGELWDRRDEVAAHLADQRPCWEARHANHWKALRRRIAGSAPQPAELTPVPPPPSRPPQPRGWWATIARAGAADSDAALWREIELAEHRESAERYARSLHEVLVAREEELLNVKALVEELRVAAAAATAATATSEESPASSAGEADHATAESGVVGRTDPSA